MLLSFDRCFLRVGQRLHSRGANWILPIPDIIGTLGVFRVGQVVVLCGSGVRRPVDPVVEIIHACLLLLVLLFLVD